MGMHGRRHVPAALFPEFKPGIQKRRTMLDVLLVHGLQLERMCH